MLTPHPFSGETPRCHLHFRLWPPTAVIDYLCAVEGCGHGDHGVHLFCPQPWGKQDKGMRTDRLREGAAPSLLCVFGPVSQSFSLCWEERLLAGLFTPESTPSCLMMASLQVFPSVFSFPPCLHSAVPAVLMGAPSLIPPPLVLWAWSRAAWRNRGCPSNMSSSFPLLRVGPELAAFLLFIYFKKCIYLGFVRS